MRYIALLFLAGTLMSYGQDTETQREKVSLETGIGIATVHTKNVGALFGINQGVALRGVVYQDGWLSLRTGLGYGYTMFENHAKTNTTNSFLSVPVSVRFTGDRDGGLAPFVEFGLYGKSLLTSQTQYEKLKTFDGFSTGMRIEIGVLLTQSPKYSVGIKLLSEGDFYSTVKYKGERYNFGNASIGLEFRLK